MKFLLLLLAFTFTGCPSCSPIAPTEQQEEEEEINWECERVLTHPIRQTYAQRCVDPITGDIRWEN